MVVRGTIPLASFMGEVWQVYLALAVTEKKIKKKKMIEFQFFGDDVERRLDNDLNRLFLQGSTIHFCRVQPYIFVW